MQGPLAGWQLPGQGRQGRQQGLRIGAGLWPHQGHQPLPPEGIGLGQQQQRRQRQLGRRRQGHQPLLHLLGEHGFTAALDGPIQPP